MEVETFPELGFRSTSLRHLGGADPVLAGELVQIGPPPRTRSVDVSDSSGQPLPPPVEWNPPVPGSTWTPTGAVPAPGPGATVELDLPSTPPARPHRGKRIALVGGVVALVAAAVFAVASLASRDEGGAGSPQGAVEALVAAVNESDALGALDVLLPGERRMLRGPLVDIAAQLRRLGILDTSADLGAVGGAQIRIDVDRYGVDEVADDIANVTIEGSASIRLDASEVPLGPVILDDLLDGEELSGTVDEEVELGGRDGPAVQVTTVRDGGRWYVSIGYSIAEQARAASGADLPSAAEAVAARGASSPEAAVEQMVKALTRFDLELVLASLDPDEFAALQRYAPIFLDDAQDELSEAGAKVSVGDLELDVERHGDSALVGFRAFSLTASAEGETARVDFDGECVSVAAEGEEYSGCAADAPTLDSLDTDSAEPGDYLAIVAKTLAGSHPIKVAKVRGEWYVSVIGSVLDSMVSGLKGLEPDDVTNAIDTLRSLVEEG